MNVRSKRLRCPRALDLALVTGMSGWLCLGPFLACGGGSSKAEAPTVLKYSFKSVTWTVGETITPLQPTLTRTWKGATFSVAPALPDGLTLDAATGILSGAPTTPTSGPVTCRVTATSPAGQSAAVDLVLTVVARSQAPDGLTYTQAAPVYQAGTAIPAPNTPTLAAGAAGVTYAATNLPAGLTLDPATGIITGTPTTPTPAPVTCRITATNPAGQSTTVDLVITVVAQNSPPAGLTYAQAAPVYQAGTALPAANQPTLAAGAAGVTYTATNLPAGLQLNPTTGVITGTPTTPTPAPVTCRITATNPAGQSTTVDLVITVAAQNPPPAGLTYAQAGPFYLVQFPIAPNLPTLAAGAGPGVTYTATNLPAGLALNAATGVITGTPTTPMPAPVICRVTATAAAGPATFVDLPITVDTLRYPGLTPEYAVGLAINPVAAAAPGPAGTTYAVLPALPAGLNLDPVTGVIAGTPTVATPGRSYAVTATLAGQTARIHLWLTVTPTPRFSEVAATYTVGVPIQANRPVHGQGLTAVYAVAPGLPAGLHLDPNTGAITGAPTLVVPGAVYTVTATQASGAASHAQLSLAVQAARAEAYDVPGVLTLGTLTGAQFDYPGIRRTQQYEGVFPQAPILHAYDPGFGIRAGKWVLACSLNLKLPSTFFEALPAPVLAAIAGMGLDRSQVDILCVSQDLIWDHPGPRILFRPQSWTDPDAPLRGSYNTGRTVGVGLFEAPPGIHIQGPGALLDHFNHGISVHPEAGLPLIAPSIISSGDSMPFQGLDPAVSTSFTTLTRLGNRAAVTLHLLLNDGDEATLQGVLAGMAPPVAPDLRTLFHLLRLSPLNGTRMVNQLLELARPIPAHAQVGPPLNPAGDRVLTLTGTGFTGATGVTLGAQIGQHLHVVSDTQIDVTILAPAAPVPDIVVTTPLGQGQIAYP